jgi:hypothetical protein
MKRLEEIHCLLIRRRLDETIDRTSAAIELAAGSLV